MKNRAARRAAVRRRVATGKDVMKRAEVECDRLADSLKKVVPGPKAAQERITHAMRPKAEGMADTGDGQRLATLVELGREFPSWDEATRARGARWKVTEARLGRCAALSEDALAAERYDATPTLGDDARAQAEVDRWDGINLQLLAFIVRAFQHGNRALASVPRLRVEALRSAMNLHVKKKKPATKPADPPKPA